MLEFAISVFLLAFTPTSADQLPQSWPQWRGPSRDGHSEGPHWPDSLASAHLQAAWRVELGPSYSGPIVIDDRVFVTETRDRRWEAVRAFDRSSGNGLWEKRWEGAMTVPFFAKSNGDWIRATPAYDDGCLYVAGMRDVLMCLDAGSGDEKWRVNFVDQLGTPLPSFGFVSSPLIVEDHVFVQAGGGLTKLDKKTGNVVWQALKDEGGMQGGAFSSPCFVTLAGKEQIVVQTRQTLAGVAPESGEVLWSQDIPAFRGMNILTPTVLGDTVFTSSYGGRSLLLRIESIGTLSKPTEQWSNKSQGYMSTPVVVDGHAYLHLRNQRFACIDLATGEEKWRTKPFGKYWSLVARGDRLLALDERGTLLLIRANSERFELLDSREISQDPTWAHLAVCGDALFVRELNALAAYKWNVD